MYDLVILLKYEHIDRLMLGFEYIKKNLEFEDVIIITTTDSIDKLGILKDITVIDENTIAKDLSYNAISKILLKKCGNPICTANYLQVFLKMAYSRICRKKAYFLWDADTIPLKPFIMSTNDKYYFDMKTEYFMPYFRTQKNILNLPKTDERSFISEHMLIDTMIMRNMLDKIEENNTFDGDTFFEKILNAVEFEDFPMLAFSEFESYGSFVDTYYPNLYIKRNYNSFRYANNLWGGYINAEVIQWIEKTMPYQAISIELWNTPSRLASIFSNKLIRKIVNAGQMMKVYELLHDIVLKNEK